MSTYGILIDVTRCVGCETCVRACTEDNKLEKFIPAPQHSPDGLGGNRWTSIIKRPTKEGLRYVKKQCRHCSEPACASACLVGALRKLPEGPVVYDKSKCMGCRYCMMACPYNIPRYQWDKIVPGIQKCDMCFDRITKGQQCACVEACPENVLMLDNRDKVLVEAKKRIKENPKKYINTVYGENEIGGTSVLYISDIPLDFLSGNKELGTKPLPNLTWASLSKVPAEFIGMGALMTGLFWIIGRRNKLMYDKAQAAMAQEAEKKEESLSQKEIADGEHK
ncbi:4Fe-4S dicluster domain-containing protein [Planctomycetota bacterium]